MVPRTIRYGSQPAGHRVNWSLTVAYSVERTASVGNTDVPSGASGVENSSPRRPTRRNQNLMVVNRRNGRLDGHASSNHSIPMVIVTDV